MLYHIQKGHGPQKKKVVVSRRREREGIESTIFCLTYKRERKKKEKEVQEVEKYLTTTLYTMTLISYSQLIFHLSLIIYCTSGKYH